MDRNDESEQTSAVNCASCATNRNRSASSGGGGCEGAPSTAAEGPAASALITVTVAPTTGGQFDVDIGHCESVENLRKLISKRLKVPKERICLLHRDRLLREGTLHENNLGDGSRVTLLPSVETGLLAQRPEQSVMQALESLNDSQVNDFLSGKAPLNLTMRLGDHMMLIQLQLSTVSPSGSSAAGRRSTSSQTTATSPPSTQTSSFSAPRSEPSPVVPAPSTQTTQTSPVPSTSSRQTASSSPAPTEASSQQCCCKSAQPPGSCRCSCHRPAPSTPAPVPSASNVQEADKSEEEEEDDKEGDREPRPVLDTKALAEASRNLTQTLKQLSAEDARGSRRRQGAIIESMHHHGKGVYSGTFSGTLNPALQDKHGRPKRDISTIIHILNDLLCATPPYRRHHSRSSAGASSSQAPAGVSVPSTSGASGVERPTPSRVAHAVPERPHPVPGTNRVKTVTGETARLNQATRGKVERLKLVMEERRNRRKARREAARSTPYPNPNPNPVPAGSQCYSAPGEIVSQNVPNATTTATISCDEEMDTSESTSNNGEIRQQVVA